MGNKNIEAALTNNSLIDLTDNSMGQFNFITLLVTVSSLFLTGEQTPNRVWKKFDPNSIKQYKKDKLIYLDNFEQGMQNWVVETRASPNSKVGIENGKLVIDVEHGATAWFNNKLSGNILIEYSRKVIMDNGPNDRLSDLNQFWMADDPWRENLFTRNGTFAEYDSLRLYYAGIGGNSNSTTRFRKYPGNGERILLYDLSDEQYLLQPNKAYLIQLVVYRGTIKVFFDGKEYFSFQDDEPLTEGYFGFRTVKSHQEMDYFKVYSLK